MADRSKEKSTNPRSRLTIRYPKAGQQLPSRQFAAACLMDKTVGPITGFLVDAAKRTYSGQAVPAPHKPGEWFILFREPPAGGPFTLVVKEIEGKESDQVEGLRIPYLAAPSIFYPECNMPYCNANFWAWGVADPQVDTAQMNGIDAVDILRNGMIWVAVWDPLAAATYVLVVTDYDGNATECPGLVLDPIHC